MPNRPPFYCDYLVEPVDGEPRLDVANLQLLKSRFMLEKVVVDHLDQVRALRGIKFDWGRYDPNQDHVYANQAFTRKLDELGIEHEAEEYRRPSRGRSTGSKTGAYIPRCCRSSRGA